MSRVEEVTFRANIVEQLEKQRGEINDLSAIITSAHRLVGGLLLTGEVDDSANDEEAIDAVRGLLTIARRSIRYLSAEVDEAIARVDASAPPA